MPRTLTLDHSDVNKNDTTYLASDITSNATALTVKNIAGFSVNDYLLIGQYGGSQTEIVQVSSITAPSTITVTACSYPHPADTQVWKTDYNQFKAYRSTSGVGGTYTLISVQNLLPDLRQNVYSDPSASSPFSYQLSYFNSTTSIESDKSDEIPFSGFPFYTVKYMQDRTLTLFSGGNQDLVTRGDITDWLNEVVEDVEYAVLGGESPYYVTSVNIQATGAASYPVGSYSMLHIYRIDLSYDGVNFKDTINPVDARANTTAEGTAYSFSLNGSNLFVTPQINSGVFRIWYATYPTLLINQSDSLPDPFKGQTRMFIEYCLMRCYERDRKMDKSKYFSEKYISIKKEVVPKLVSRLKSPSMGMITSWADDYSMLGG